MDSLEDVVSSMMGDIDDVVLRAIRTIKEKQLKPTAVERVNGTVRTLRDAFALTGWDIFSELETEAARKATSLQE